MGLFGAQAPIAGMPSIDPAQLQQQAPPAAPSVAPQRFSNGLFGSGYRFSPFNFENNGLSLSQKIAILGGGISQIGGQEGALQQAYGTAMSQNMLGYKRQLIRQGLKDGSLTEAQAIAALTGDDALQKGAGDLLNTTMGKQMEGQNAATARQFEVDHPKGELGDFGGSKGVYNPYAIGSTFRETRSPNRPPSMAEVYAGMLGGGEGGLGPSVPQAGAPPQIPSQAIDALRGNPGLAAQFDAKYGTGASAQFTGR